MTRLRLRLLIGLMVAAALAFSASPDIRAAAKAAATTMAAGTASGTTASSMPAAKAKTTAATTATASQAGGKMTGAGGRQNTVAGKKGMGQAGGQMRTTTQAQRQAARAQAGAQKKGTSVMFAGVSTATATLSPLAAATTLGTTATLATMAPGAVPDYFGVANYANSPLPIFGGTVQVPVQVGNPLIARAVSSDYPVAQGTLAPVLVVLNTPLPAGTLQSFQYFNQPATGGGYPSAGQTFHALVLRPTGVANQYSVILDNGLYTIPTPTNPAGEIETVVVTPQAVNAGDLVAFYGSGIPVDITAGTDTLVYALDNSVPLPSGTITLGAAPYPIYPSTRTYSFGAVVTVTQASGAIQGGMRKFVDALPTLPIAKPDTGTFPGSDYYEISLEEYYQVMHSDLKTANGGKGTKLRGYRQINGPSPQATPSYLGPVILATKNKPVRVRFINNLPIGAGGNLFIPTDTTYMGAGNGPDGTPYTENRATLHLHGGNTPWISDGTPHQWTAPKNETTNFKKGVSTRNVPDMWFDASGNLLPASSGCQGKRTCAVAGATNDPGNGSMTFYWTNQQSGRLMFYHDHAYGVTRLNVYAGEAAGYLVADPTEENQLAAASVPGTIGTTPDLAHLVPLVIQDKTFVPDDGTAGGQLAATDPTWDTTKWGGFGNLWYPHVYTPNQNPYDPSGANAFGRWDYGPWFWPPQDPATLVGLPYPCGNSVCPGVPNVSGTPEAFMDTPVVNGKAYPTLTVDPAAYRFRILNAANDRTLSLSYFVADNLSIAVINPGSGYNPAAPPAVTLTATNGVTGTGTATAVVSTGVVTGITVTGAGSGYTTAPLITLDPPACTLNGTTCVQATAMATISAAAGSTGGPVTSIVVTNAGAGYTTAPNVTFNPQVAGGACSPAGPACASAIANIAPAGQLIAIDVTGASGWTAAPTVTIAPPASGLQAKAIASVNTEVKMVDSVPHTSTSALPLCAAPTQFPAAGGLVTGALDATGNPLNGTGLPAGCWPTSWPTDARDGGVPDPTTAGPAMVQIGTEGGLLPAPVVIPAHPTGFEYNRRSITVLNIFQHGLLLGPAERADVVVDFSKYAGKTLILYNDAPAPVPAFDPRIDYYTGDPDQSDTGGAPTTLPGYGPNTRTIMQVVVNATGTANTVPFSVSTLNASMPGIFAGTVAAPNQAAPIVKPGTYARIQDTQIVNGTGSVIGVDLTAAGSGYTSAPTVSFVPAGATATATIGGPLTGVNIGNPGAAYNSATVTIGAPACTINGTTCVRATATATVSGGRITAITLTNVGNGYASLPAVTISAPNGNPTKNRVQATAVATWAGGSLTAVTVTNPTASVNTYSAVPSVFFTGGGGKGAIGTAQLSNTFALTPKAIQELFTLDYGRMNATLGVELPFTNFLTQTTIPYGYIDPPTELFKDGETQLWKITHNGVDTHFMHFHLFNVQVVNRVGWDGSIKPPDANELGWKDTVRMNPLEDVVVALTAMKQTTINPTDLDVSNLPNSVRALDVTMPLGSSGQFTDVDPANQPAVVTNDLTNFGWEYVWHCHILGHEENDMMRAMVMLVPPAAPTNLVLTAGGTNQAPTVIVNWTNNAANATGFVIQRAPVVNGVVGTMATIGSTAGNVTTFTDRSVARGSTYAYQVVAVNTVGYTKVYAAPAAGYPNQTASSAPSVQKTITR